MVGGLSFLLDFFYSKFCMFVEFYWIFFRENFGFDLWKMCNKYIVRLNLIECILFLELCKF